MIAVTIIAYIVIEFAAKVGTEPAIGAFSSIDLIIISFVISTAIAIIAVIAGVGGGVIFTPIMLAFTSIDTLIIRSTGLVVAMFSGLVSTGPFMRKGLADVKLVFFGAVPIIVGGLGGAFSAIILSSYMGAAGDAIVRLLLGVTLVLIALLFIFGGSNTEYPRPRKIDALGQRLRLRNTYWEESLHERIRYRAVNVTLGGFLFLLSDLQAAFRARRRLGRGAGAEPCHGRAAESFGCVQRCVAGHGQCCGDLALYYRRRAYWCCCRTLDVGAGHRRHYWRSYSRID